MKLSVIISERDDPVGTMITVRSVIEELKSCDFDGEVVVVDNSTDKYKSKALVDILKDHMQTNEVKLFTQSFQCLFSARDAGVKNAFGEYIMVLDSHCLLYKDTLKSMISFADSTPNLGMLFGSMCYSKAHSDDGFVDRDVRTFVPIRKCAYPSDQKVFKIPLRSMPYMISRDLYTFMRGYAPLSTHKLAWGGGDFLISFKPLLLGYDNWILTDYGAVHLGPFSDRGWFAGSFIFKGSPYGRHLGMLTAAYVIGGEQLLNTRKEQLCHRRGIPSELNRMQSQAVEYGAAEHRWIESNKKISYASICDKFAGTQGDIKTRHYPIEDILPRAKFFKSLDNYAFVPKPVYSKIKQTTGVRR